MADDCIFCAIAERSAPAEVVQADSDTIAFLDINPATRGHTLVIPREEVDTLDKLSDASAAAIGKALPRIARAVLAATGTQHFNILQNNGAPAHQAVMHVHFHIIPKYDDGTGLGIGWKSTKIDDAETLAAAIADLV